MSRGNAAVTQIPNFLFNYRRPRRLSFLTAAQIHQTPSLLLEGRCRSLGLARSQTTGLWLRANHPALSAVTWDFFLRWALDAFLPFPELNLSHCLPKMVRYVRRIALLQCHQTSSGGNAGYSFSFSLSLSSTRPARAQPISSPLPLAPRRPDRDPCRVFVFSLFYPGGLASSGAHRFLWVSEI